MRRKGAAAVPRILGISLPLFGVSGRQRCSGANEQKFTSEVDRLSTTETVIQKLRVLVEGVESLSPLGNQNAISRRRRLLRVSEGIARIATKLARPFCNCRFSTIVDIEHAEEFQAAMNVPCPIHGPGRLGLLVIVSVDDPYPGQTRLEDLIQEYDRRWRRWKEVGNEWAL